MEILTGAALERKRKQHKCGARFCTKHSVGASILCSKHRHERVRETNPLRYWFDLLRSNARRRRHAFTLTIEQFTEFCERTNYIALKGRGVGNYSIDRINPKRGYEADNIQIMEIGDNVRKRYVDEKIFGKHLAAPAIDVSDFVLPDNMSCESAPF